MCLSPSCNHFNYDTFVQIEFVWCCQSRSENEKCHILLKLYSIQIWLFCIKSARCEVSQRTNWVVSYSLSCAEEKGRKKKKQFTTVNKCVIIILWGFHWFSHRRSSASPALLLSCGWMALDFYSSGGAATQRSLAVNSAMNDTLAGSDSWTWLMPRWGWFPSIELNTSSFTCLYFPYCFTILISQRNNSVKGFFYCIFKKPMRSSK